MKATLLKIMLLSIVLFASTVITVEASPNVGFAWSYGDWSSRVAWEARNALSQRTDGTSAWPISNDSYGPRWYGDWNYVSSDGYARDKAAWEAMKGTNNTDLVGLLDDDQYNHHRGGQCTFFVRLILYRATYWAGYGVHLTMPGHPGSVYSWTSSCCMTQNYGSVQPGWVFSSPNRHMAIADKRDYVNGQWGWWFIDSNYVGGSGNFFIGKHFMPDWKLLSDNYWAWKPSWATYN